MRIVHCAFEMEVGGSQVLVVNLINQICNDHDVSLIIINRQFNENLLKQINKKAKIYFMNRKQGSRSPLPVIKLNLLLLKLQPHIIHCHEYDTARFIKSGTAKLVYTIHAQKLPDTYLHLYHSRVAVSNAVCQEVYSRCRCEMAVIYNGIDAGLFERRSNYTTEKDKLYKLVQVGRLIHLKGQDILINGLHKLIYEQGIANVLLDFIGNGDSLPYLEEQVSRLNLGNYVRFLGEKESNWLYENLCHYDILVQPSRNEGFGLTILEAFAAGLLVLASNTGGPAEILHSLPGGALFESENSADCADKLFKLLKIFQNNEAEGLLKLTIPEVKKKYSISACSDNYLNHYWSLLKPSIKKAGTGY